MSPEVIKKKNCDRKMKEKGVFMLVPQILCVITSFVGVRIVLKKKMKIKGKWGRKTNWVQTIGS